MSCTNSKILHHSNTNRYASHGPNYELIGILAMSDGTTNRRCKTIFEQSTSTPKVARYEREFAGLTSRVRSGASLIPNRTFVRACAFATAE